MKLILKRVLFKRTFLTLALILILNYIEFEQVIAVRVPSPVEINKCCRIGETLDRNKHCSIGGSSDQWWPLIYLIGKGSYFVKQGEAPRFMRAIEFKQPSCERPEMFLNNIALFSNGSLFLGERNTFIDRNDYCVDKDVALVCLPSINGVDSLMTSIRLTKIRKCCSLNEFIHAQNCAPQEAIPSKLFEIKNASQIDLVYGFPLCNGPSNAHNKYVIAEQFRENNLNIKNGTYALENTHKVLRNNEFCIDHTSNQSTNSIVAVVFACDDLVAVTDVPESRIEEVR